MPIDFTSASNIEAHYRSQPLNDEARMYLAIHSRRFAYLLQMVKKYRGKISAPSIRILDIGPSFFTEILRLSFPNDEIHTLGFTHLESRGGHLPECVFINPETFNQFNLNDAQEPDKWIKTPPMQIVVMAEVLEHLYAAPEWVLQFLASNMAAGGYLILGTPNATATMKRVKLLFGYNPYERIRTNFHNPGHFREYTLSELREIGQIAGFNLAEGTIKNYFYYPSFKTRVMLALKALQPPFLKDGLTAVLQKK